MDETKGMLWAIATLIVATDGLWGCSTSNETTSVAADATSELGQPDGSSSGNAARSDGGPAGGGSADSGYSGSTTPGASLSCAPGGEGMTNCGAGGNGSESCCASLEVTGGTFYR